MSKRRDGENKRSSSWILQHLDVREVKKGGKRREGEKNENIMSLSGEIFQGGASQKVAPRSTKMKTDNY